MRRVDMANMDRHDNMACWKIYKCEDQENLDILKIIGYVTRIFRRDYTWYMILLKFQFHKASYGRSKGIKIILENLRGILINSST